MILHQVNYHNEHFHFDALEFKKNNLIVGRNAIGKTRVINALHHIGQMILGKLDLHTPLSFTLKFRNADEKNLTYEMDYNGELV